MAEIRLSQLTKRYPPGIIALADLTLTVSDGERMVLVGPSGCGKTTTLRIVAGLESPDAGHVWINGRDATRQAPADRSVSMVFQDENQFPHLTVRENLAVGLRMRRVPAAEIRQRVADTATELDLHRLLDRWPQELSGGERQRVAVGRALASGARICLMDEPLSNVDPSQRSELRDAIRRFHRRARCSMIYVTHDQAEAMMMGQRIAVMHRGQIFQVGTPKQIYGWPRTTFVARFIGSLPMNLLPGDWRGHRLRVLDQEIQADLIELSAGPVQVGVRAEQLKADARGPIRFRGTVQHVEYLGQEQIVRMNNGPTAFSVRLPTGVDTRPGEQIELGCELADLYLFAADTDGQLLGRLDGARADPSA